MLLVAVILGGIVGGVLVTLNNDPEAPATVADLLTTTSTTNSVTTVAPAENVQSNESSITPDVGALGESEMPQGRRRGLNIEPLGGTLTSLSPTGLILASHDTGAAFEITVPPETPVLFRETAGGSNVLTAGTEIIASLQRSAEGSITARNINLLGFSEGRNALRRLGGAERGLDREGGTATEGAEFNAVPGTITNFMNGALTLETADGSVTVTVDDDTPVQFTIAFSDLDNQLVIDSQVTIIGQRNDAGIYTPITIASGIRDGLWAAEGGLGGGRRGQRGDGTQGSGREGSLQRPQ